MNNPNTVELKPGERVEIRVVYIMPDGTQHFGDWIKHPVDDSVKCKKMYVERRIYKFHEGVSGGSA